MNWREAAFVTVFTVIVLAALKLLLVASVAVHGAWVALPIAVGVGLAFGYWANWLNRGSETILRQSLSALHLDDEPERLDASPPVLALPPPEPEGQTFPDRRE